MSNVVLLPNDLYHQRVRAMQAHADVLNVDFVISAYAAPPLLTDRELDAYAAHIADYMMQGFFDHGTWPMFVTVTFDDAFGDELRKIRAVALPKASYCAMPENMTAVIRDALTITDRELNGPEFLSRRMISPVP